MENIRIRDKHPGSATLVAKIGAISAVGEPTVLSSSVANSVADPDSG
jgi:hypothetical protein